jgi:predicted nucleotidyltransferase
VFPFEDIFRRLNEAAIRYVVVGGVAVVLHGIMRFTADLDLVIDLGPDEAKRAMDVFGDAGFRAQLPVPLSDFANAEKRRGWIAEKNMVVFSILDRETPPNVVDVFAESPIGFESLYERAVMIPLESTSIRVASLDDLIDMKRETGRAKDLLDIEELEKLRNQ